MNLEADLEGPFNLNAFSRRIKPFILLSFNIIIFHFMLRSKYKAFHNHHVYVIFSHIET